MKVKYENLKERREKSKRIKIIILWISLFWVSTIVILGFFYFHQNQKINEISKTMNPTSQARNPSVSRVEQEKMGKDISPDKVLGVWISNREPETLLEFNQDFTYRDDLWLGHGFYEINGSFLLLNDQTERENEKRVLRYKKEGEKEELFFTIGQYSTTFRKASKKEVEEVRENINAIKKENGIKDEDYKEIAFQFLLSRSWTTEDKKEITFTKDSFTIKDKNILESYQYKPKADVIFMEDPSYSFVIPWIVENTYGIIPAKELEIFYGKDMPPYIVFSINGIEYKAYSKGVPYFCTIEGCG